MISSIDIHNHTQQEIGQKLQSLNTLSDFTIKNLLKNRPYLIVRGDTYFFDSLSTTMVFVNKNKLVLFSLPNFLWLIVAFFLALSMYYNLQSYWLTLKAYELSPAPHRGSFNFSILSLQISSLIMIMIFGFLPMYKDKKYIVQQLNLAFS